MHRRNCGRNRSLQGVSCPKQPLNSSLHDCMRRHIIRYFVRSEVSWATNKDDKYQRISAQRILTARSILFFFFSFSFPFLFLYRSYTVFSPPFPISPNHASTAHTFSKLWDPSTNRRCEVSIWKSRCYRSFPQCQTHFQAISHLPRSCHLPFPYRDESAMVIDRRYFDDRKSHQVHSFVHACTLMPNYTTRCG